MVRAYVKNKSLGLQRPPSAFALFFKAEHSRGQLTLAMASARWKRLGSEQKAVFQKEAKDAAAKTAVSWQQFLQIVLSRFDKSLWSSFVSLARQQRQHWSLPVAMRQWRRCERRRV